MNSEQVPDNHHIFNSAEITQPAKSGTWKWMLPLSVVLAISVFAAWHFNWHAKAVTTGVVIFATISHVFAWIVAMVGLIPIIGPLIVKVLSIGVIWLLNAIGYLVSYVAIKRGYSKDVLTYRAVTVALIVGIVIGYILCNLIS
jgi:hypothetical protein